MKLIVRLTTLVVVVALSLACAPRLGYAGAAATPAAKNCVFVRNNLACPCPRAQEARAVARAARVTAEALGSAIGTTATVLARVSHNHGARNKS